MFSESQDYDSQAFAAADAIAHANGFVLLP
jgi:hypothetical protein